MRIKSIQLATLLLLLAITGITFAADGDWPMCRGDGSRTGASGNPLSDQLSLLWHQNLGYPDAAFIHQFRMCADAAYAPVAADGLVFVPSNLRDEVAALDLTTGNRVWRYITEGPVRFAPVFHDGKLYFGSDDGLIYCLQADRGELLWKVRGAPDHLPVSKLLINGRLCSRWPVRGAPVLYQGKIDTLYIIYEREIQLISAADSQKQDVFTIPEEIASASEDSIWTEVRLSGNYLCCVVDDTLVCLDRRTGKLLWQRQSALDSTSYALSDTALFGVDYITPPGVYRGESHPRKESILFRLDLKSGDETWTANVEHDTVPQQNPKQQKPWLLPITPPVSLFPLPLLSSVQEPLHVI